MKKLSKIMASLTIMTLMVVAVPPVLAQQAQPEQQQKKWTEQAVKDHVRSWKKTPKEVAGKMLERYGVPDEVTDHRLVWNRNGDWVETILTNEEIAHDFPMPHKDCLEQVVSYDVPVEKYSEIAEYDGSVITERTQGTMAARCDKEPMNYLALNLAHDIVEGTKTVEEARDFYARTVVAFINGEKSDYTQKLNFSQKQGTGDKDKPLLDQRTIKDLKKKMKN